MRLDANRSIPDFGDPSLALDAITRQQASFSPGIGQHDSSVKTALLNDL